jgi:hypothetical protein
MKRAALIIGTVALALIISAEPLAAYLTFGQPSVRSGPAFLIVDARPLDAQVFLDGKPLGTARDVMARALPVETGDHVLLIVHPGFRPFTVRFPSSPGAYPAIIRTTLIPV